MKVTTKVATWEMHCSCSFAEFTLFFLIIQINKYLIKTLNFCRICRLDVAVDENCVVDL